MEYDSWHFRCNIAFAIEMTKRAISIYETAVEKGENPFLKETLKALLKEEKKNDALMEDIRRENLTEMILEPIAGFEEEEYRINVNISGDVKDVDLVKIALALEEQEQKFFKDLVLKIPFLEVNRTFRKIAEKRRSIWQSLNPLASRRLKRS
jgi:rubrerythrin